MRFGWALGLAGLILACMADVSLADAGAISVSPAFHDLTFSAGTAEERVRVKVTNGLDIPLTLQLSVLDFGSLDESGGVAFQGAGKELEKAYGLADWMRLDDAAVTLQPREEREIEVTIVNEETLSPGGHYGALLFRAESAADGRDNPIAINQSFSTLMFVKKEGGERYGLTLAESEFSRTGFLLPDLLRLRFENTGNVHSRPRGTVRITDPFGRLVAKGIINEESGLVLPESQRVFAVPLLPLTFLWWPGPYQLETAYRYEGQTEADVAHATLFVFPWPALIGLAGLSLLAALFFRKRFARPAESEQA